MCKRLVDAIIKKWFCCHEWELIDTEEVVVKNSQREWGCIKTLEKRYFVNHYFCKKCGRYLRTTNKGIKKEEL